MRDRLGALFAILLFCVAVAANGQGGSWDAVKNLPAEERVRVDTSAHRESCIFISADEANLICERRSHIFLIPYDHRITFRKADVHAVRISHRVRSAFAGAGVGAALGMGIGAGIDAHYSASVFGDHAGLAFWGVLGAVLGQTIGQHLDFLAGPIIYKAP
jgi:hypothetical protein